jgi:secreted PhoX family phosphatase
VTDRNRRAFLQDAFLSLGLMAVGTSFVRCQCDARASSDGRAAGADPPPKLPTIEAPQKSRIAELGPLGRPDSLGVRLPKGFTARIVARASHPVEGTSFAWHEAPDGGATFLAPDGGWVYVSNSEALSGGASAVRFDASGKIVDAYSILTGTHANCAGGPTPWGTWLSCEEHAHGRVWECDPFGKRDAAARPALGVFRHEAVAVDPVHHHLYLTEDVPNGRLYRFTPATLREGRPDLSAGTLHVMRVRSGEEGEVDWLRLPDSFGTSRPTRNQVPESTAFNGGEGIWWHDGVVYFSTKGDNRVWAYDTKAAKIAIVYDDDRAANPLLSGVDNVTVSAGGDILVAEDSGDMELVALDGKGRVAPIVQVMGQGSSEITGPALDPYRKRLYFSSQRGAGLHGRHGITYEITGPFFT